MRTNDAIAERKLTTSTQQGVPRLNDSLRMIIQASSSVPIVTNDRLYTSLSRLPKTLYDLWYDYTVVLEGRKHAKLCTSQREADTSTCVLGGR